METWWSATIKVRFLTDEPVDKELRSTLTYKFEDAIENALDTAVVQSVKLLPLGRKKR